MLESYIRTGDGKEYIDVNCVREALGIVDEYVDIFGVIKKLKEERDGLEADLELTKRLYKENREFVDKVCEAVDIWRPCTESGYDHAVKSIAEIKKERDELKEKCDKLKKRANTVYGVSCGYSASKEPTFRYNVTIDELCDKYNQVIELRDRNADLESKFQFQSGLRQQWHARYESEHKRANGVQKALDREREKCRVKDISLETAKKQYEKVCSNLETAECAVNGMKSKVRELQEEKTKVISALGQDIWDDCLK